LRHGAIVARDMVLRPGEFVMAIHRAQEVVLPSLPLTTLASVLHPDARLDIDWQGQGKRIGLLYETEPGAYLRERDRIDLTAVFEQGRPEFALQPGDIVACSTLSLNGPEYWERLTVPYEKLLSCNDDELQELVMNRLIIVGDLRTRRLGVIPDRHRVRYGVSIVENVPGCYLMADAVAGLLDRRYMKSAFPLAPTSFLLMLLAAVVGCLLPVGLMRKNTLRHLRYRRGLWVTLLTGSVACFLLVVVARSYAAVHAGMAGFSLLAPMAGSLWVELARNRHRILDKSRQAIESFGLSSDGTVTLASRPAKSFQETG
jgi:hypothetical protein